MGKGEVVLSFLAEGGSISIVRVIIDDKDVFIMKTNEMAFDEMFCLPRREQYPTFSKAFAAIDKSYTWDRLHLEYVKERYKELLCIKLVKRCRKPGFDWEWFDYTKRRFEEVLEYEF